MANTVCITKNSIGKKILMGLTGLVWSGFVLTHMLGNMLIFAGAEKFNMYSYKLTSLEILPLLEGFLVLMLLVHVIFAIKLTLENKRARPQGYAVAPSGPKRASAASRSMAYTGSLVLAFIILHLVNFKYGAHYTATYNGLEVRDIYRVVIEAFQQPGYVAWYVLCLVLLGVHLSHGFSSSFQSLGINHPRYTPMIKKLGCIYSILVAGGFIAQPLYVFFVMR